MENRIVKKSKKILNDFKDKNNVYYRELSKTFNEYEKIDIFDDDKRMAYLKHLNELNGFLDSEKYSNILIFFMSLVLFTMCGLTIYTAKQYSNLSKEFNDNVILNKDDVNIQVEYLNVENFNALTNIESNDYSVLDPITIKVSSTSKVKNNYTVKYLVFLEEENGDLSNEEILNKSDFNYDIHVNDGDLGKKDLALQTYYDENKILLYSGSFKASEVDNIDFRMWLKDKDVNSYINKKYKFKLNVQGYVL